MPNTNGLTSLAPVYDTGAPDSNIWASRVAPTVVSPLLIRSPDGTDIGAIYQNDNGNMVISSAPAGTLFLADDQITFGVNEGPNFILRAGSQLQVVGENQAALKSYNSGNLLGIAADAFVNKGGANGILYDSVYNKVATVNASTYTSPSVPVDTDVAIGSGSLPAGLYMLQAKVNIDITSTPYVAGTSINCYVENAPGAPPTTYFPFSSILITAGALAAPIAPDTNVDATFSSAVFSIPDGLTGLKYFVEVDGAWNLGGGNLQLQLVKLG